MCGIAGILNKNNQGVTEDLILMLSCMHNRGPDGVAIQVGQNKPNSLESSELSVPYIDGRFGLGHVRLAIVGGQLGRQPFTSCDGRLTLEHNGEIYNYKQIRNKLSTDHDFVSTSDSEVILHFLEEKLAQSGSLLKALRKMARILDGVYSIAVKDHKTGQIALVRDLLGVRQLYYSEDSEQVTFASEQKAIWLLGGNKSVRRVMPGHAVIITNKGNLREYRIAEPPNTLDSNKSSFRYNTLEGAIRAYKRALMLSMKKRTEGLDRIGIIFSGGIDSVLVAWLAKDLVKEVICYNAGTLDSSDILFADKVAKDLQLTLKVNVITKRSTQEMLPKIIHAIEERDSLQVEVALPIYSAMALAKKDHVKVVFSGQGTDEILGGYSWYPSIVAKEGYSSLRNHMLEDLFLLYKETLEREDKTTMAHGIEMREPYLDRQVIKTAFDINPKLNVRGPNDHLGKHVHRKLAAELGIPNEIAYRNKAAAQHGSGIHFLIDEIARENNFDESKISSSYLDELQKRELLGSSQRYGFRYGNKELWLTSPHIQMYLDRIYETVFGKSSTFIDTSEEDNLLTNRIIKKI
jgi:asparagine synthase (glutamine-hydrolysing)